MARGIIKRFPNLSAELARIGISGIQVADHIGMTKQAFYYKSSGKRDFTISELIKIQKLINEESNMYYTLDYLFKEREE